MDINETVELTDQLKEEILSQVEVKNLRFSSGSESNPNTTATSAPAFYGETVTDIYALETNTYTTVQYQGDASAAEELLLLLEGMPEYTVKTSSTERAYIVFTETGRHYIYLDKESTSKALWDLWEEITSFEENGRHIHWFTHMTPEKITEIRSGLGSLLTERADIEAAAEFLKKQVRIDPTKGISISEGADNPNMSAALYHIVITFDTGVEYSIIGYGDYAGMIDEGGSGISIWTSDLDRTVYYTLTEGCAAEIRQFFAQQ